MTFPVQRDLVYAATMNLTHVPHAENIRDFGIARAGFDQAEQIIGELGGVRPPALDILRDKWSASEDGSALPVRRIECGLLVADILALAPYNISNNVEMMALASAIPDALVHSKASRGHFWAERATIRRIASQPQPGGNVAWPAYPGEQLAEAASRRWGHEDFNRKVTAAAVFAGLAIIAHKATR